MLGVTCTCLHWYFFYHAFLYQEMHFQAEFTCHLERDIMLYTVHRCEDNKCPTVDGGRCRLSKPAVYAHRTRVPIRQAQLTVMHHGLCTIHDAWLRCSSWQLALDQQRERLTINAQRHLACNVQPSSSTTSYHVRARQHTARQLHVTI